MARPPHIFLDDTYYFITARTVESKKLFDSDNNKLLLANVIEEAVKQFRASLHAWVVLSNHYHILLRLRKGKDLSKLVQIIHGRSSRRLSMVLRSEGRLISLPSREWVVWRNYWDHGIRDEADF